MIPDFKTYIKESIWADIYDRSTGDSVRREDIIDNYDRDQFVDYLKARYKPIPPKPATLSYVVDFRESYLNVVAFHYMEAEPEFFRKEDRYSLTYPVNFYGIDEGNLDVCVKDREKNLPEIYDALNDKYTLKKSDQEKHISILPKDGSKPTLSFGIEVIDFLMSLVKPPFKKIIELAK